MAEDTLDDNILMDGILTKLHLNRHIIRFHDEKITRIEHRLLPRQTKCTQEHRSAFSGKSRAIFGESTGHDGESTGHDGE